MTLKEAYIKIVNENDNWVFGPILEKENYFIFSGHPINGENDMIFELPSFNKSSKNIEWIDISHGIEKTIRKINPEDL